jgi:signal transduction histidine kinase
VHAQLKNSSASDINTSEISAATLGLSGSTLPIILALLIAAIFLAAALMRQIARTRALTENVRTLDTERHALSALLDAAPVRRVDPDKTDEWDGFLATLALKDAETIALDAADLVASGTAFNRLVSQRDGEIVDVSGSTCAGRPIVWARDLPGVSNRVHQAETELSSLRDVIQTAPLAIWRRLASGSLDTLNSQADTLRLDLDDAAPLADRARSSGKPVIESRTLVVGGNRRLLEITETPDSQGGTIGTAVDLTALEDLQSQLGRQLEGQQEALSALDTAVAIFGPDRRLIMANAAFADLWRIPVELLDMDPSLGEVLEMARERRRLPEQADFRGWRDDFNRLFRTLTEPFEDLLFLPDETTIRMRVSPHVFGGLLMTFVDVTDRITLERSINTLSEVQRETLDNLHEGIAVFGVDGKLKLSNPAFRTLWSIPDDIGTGTGLAGEPHLVDILRLMRSRYPADVNWSREQDLWSGFLEDRNPRSGRVEQIGGRTVDYSVAPLPDGATLLTFQDITDTLAVQQALREQAEALSMADRLKSEFLANVSYELRTPLNAIIGFSEILKNEYAGPMNDRQQEYSAAILDSSNSLVRLVNDILDLASIEAGYLELEVGQVNFTHLTESIDTLVRERARNRGISFIQQIDPELPEIMADERRLTQALYNLVSNAFAFTSTGGEVVLEIATEDEDLVFRVRDSGVGLTDARTVGSTARFERGGRQSRTAVSLSLVKSLIELHQGNLTVGSKDGNGNEVVCRIPLQAVQRLQHVATASDNQTLSDTAAP